MITFRPNWLKNVKNILGRTTWTDSGKDEEKPDLGVQKNGSEAATYNKTLNQRQGSWMGNFAQYISGRQTD